jgi:hypothetical protein
MRDLLARVLLSGVMVLGLTTGSREATAQTAGRDSISPVTVSGFVDGYFSYNMVRPMTHTNSLRNFDVTENQFALSNAEVSVTRLATPVGFRIDLDLGPTNDLVQSGATGSIANIGQAYLTYVVPAGSGLTVDVGKFVTHMGYEVIKAKDNPNYSRSLLFAFSIPYYHLGARASYPVSAALTVSAFLYNSYNGLTVNTGKTFGFQGILAVTPALSITGNWIGGPALPDSVSKKFRNVANLIVALQATEKLSLAVDAVYGQENLPEGIALWRGAAAYLKYSFNDVSSLALRGELYSDPAGFTTGRSQDLGEATLTYEYRPASSLILRGEYRYDASTASVFDGDAGAAIRRNQATLVLGAIVVL